ncbi:MAG: coenzyme F420-0:L-glutamate ligase, partial [Clostridia bacterium]|nr:coenzyme F420-0:L-glutamate ligase [Clostridia bacterium]
MNSERLTGTTARGIRCPIIREGDDISAIVAKSVLDAAGRGNFPLNDRDVVAVTESVCARAQGNYCTVSDIAADVKAKTGGGNVGVVFPILSRNRFAICLKGIARGCEKLTLMLSYPSDEVGNHLVTLDQLDEAGVNPYSDL